MIKSPLKKIAGIIIFTSAAFFSFAQNQTQNITIIETVHQHNLNPQLTDYASDVMILTGLYEGLFTYNPITLEPQWAIAKDISISRDKKRWTFTLNPKARFSNGNPITANDVRSSWLALLNNPSAPYASLLDVIDGAEAFRTGQGSENKVGIYASDDYTLKVCLSKPVGYLLKILCHPAFSVVSKEAEVYSGPYILKERLVDDNNLETHVLEKNEYYWDKDNVYTQQITFVQSNDKTENAYKYNIGNADWICSSADTRLLINKNDILFTPEFATCFMFFKNHGKSYGVQGEGVHQENASLASDADFYIWDHVEFRQALFEAMPWEKFRSIYYVPATTFVYPLSGYPQVQGYSYTDMEEAKRLMEKAREKYDIDEEIVLPLVMEIPENCFTMEQLLLVKNAFEELGVELQVWTVPSSVYLSKIPDSKADVFVYTWIGDFADPMAFLELFRSESSLNVSGFSNADYDALLEKASQTSLSESYELYAQAETLLLDNCQVIPVHHPVTYNVINIEEIGGWSVNAFDIHPLKYLYRKEIVVSPANNVI